MLDDAFRESTKHLISPVMGTEIVAPLLYNFVMMQRPRRILEIGGGLTSIYLLKALLDSDNLFNIEKNQIDNPLKNNFYYDAELKPAQLHVIDNFDHRDTAADKLTRTASELGLDHFLTLHNVDFVGYAEKLFKDRNAYDLLFLDCGQLSHYMHFLQNYFPLVNKNGGLILIHSLLTNLHGQVFLKQLKLIQASSKFMEWEILSLLEPHKSQQNSITMLRMIGEETTSIHSVMP
tara:strand:- start:1003 stop:1704 length:702 start_codon:yes stop_codon:yes gene_type:complete